MDQHNISADGISASIRADGAELCSFQIDGREMLWQAGPAWPRHAPVLFPIIGSLAGDSMRHYGQDYPLTKHGFARDRRFEWVEITPSLCRLRLTDDAATRAMYPFAFVFEMSFSIEDGVLTVGHHATNTGTEILPVSMGAHPAFRWPLADGIAKTDHRLVFECDEPEPMPRVMQGGLLSAAIHPSVIKDRILPLDEALFADDALILPQVHSRWMRFEAPGADGFEMAWQGFPQLGLWMRPGGDFLCLEPWYGMASPSEWAGEFVDKPGMAKLAPGESLQASYSLRRIG